MKEGLIGAVLGGLQGGGGFIAQQAGNDLAAIRQREMDEQRFENEKILKQLGFDHDRTMQDTRLAHTAEQNKQDRDQRDAHHKDNYTLSGKKLEEDIRSNRVSESQRAQQIAQSGAGVAEARNARQEQVNFANRYAQLSSSLPDLEKSLLSMQGKPLTAEQRDIYQDGLAKYKAGQKELNHMVVLGQSRGWLAAPKQGEYVGYMNQNNGELIVMDKTTGNTKKQQAQGGQQSSGAPSVVAKYLNGG